MLALVAASVSRAAMPTIYFNYATDCTFQVVDDRGAAVTTLAPGAYQVVVDTPVAFATVEAGCDYVQFDLSGPGVTVTTTLGTGDSENETFTVTLQPSSTYTAQDDNSPAKTRRTFSTAATGSPVTVAAAGGGSTVSGSSGKTPASGSSSGSTSAIGTPLKAALRGTLVGTVAAGGKLTLTKNGKPVTILPTGKYDFTIVDQSRTNGFTLQAVKGNPITISAGPFVGKRSKSLVLAHGQWFYYGSFVGKKAYFLVTSST